MLTVVNFFPKERPSNMKSRSLLRAVAAVVAASLLVAIPGAPAWAQTAAMVRPGSVGAGMLGSAGAAGATTDGVGTPTSIATLQLSAPSLGTPGMAPTLQAMGSVIAVPATPIALSRAMIPAAANEDVLAGAVVKGAKPLALAASAKPAAVVPGTALASVHAAAAELAPALEAGLKAPSAAGKSEGALASIAAFFDGLKARAPQRDMVDAGEQNDAPKGPQLENPQHRLLPVLVTVTDPGSAEGVKALVEKMSADLGFQPDDSYKPVSAPGLVTVRGAIPVSRLLALHKMPGVVDVAPAAGAFSVRVVRIPAETVSAEAPRESLLRAGFRGMMTKRPMLAVLASLTLTFATFVAFLGPVTGGMMLGGAAAVMKPWMLGTAAGMATMTYLSPLFGWMPLKLRAFLSFAAAAGVATTAAALLPVVPALWISANVAIGAIAAMRGLPAPTLALRLSVVERVVGSNERAAFVNLLGYQALLPILILGGMLPLATAILAVSSVLALLLLFKSGPAASALETNPPSAPSTPEQPAASEFKGTDAPAPNKRHEPFVPASIIIAKMEKLRKEDPEAAFKAASAHVLNEKERRSEIKIASMRMLEGFPVDKSLSTYLELLRLGSRKGVQISKELSVDPWWYLQREAIKRVTREAEALKPASPELLDLLGAAYKDRNSSVRVAAGDALRAFGVDPGAEPEYAVAAKPDPKGFTAVPGNQIVPGNDQQPPKKSNAGKWFLGIVLALSIGWMSLATLNSHPAAPVTPPTTIEHVIKAPAAAPAADGVVVSKAPVIADQGTNPSVVAPKLTDSLAKADSAKAPTQDESLAQITKNTDRTAKAMEEMAKPKGSFLSSLLWAVLPIVLLVWLMRKFSGMGGGSAGGIRTSPNMDVQKPTTTFDDVAGMDETLIEVQELIDFMRDPARFKRLGARIPKGILMEGAPGTGKTLLARALAGETNANFISISGSDFVELYVGMGARRVRELFAAGKAKSPTIIFIDEIDAVGKKRGDGGPGNGGNDEREQTINQILKEMDGFDNQTGVIVIAATNRADTLDPALTRPGRFDRKIHVGLPEALGREAILALHSKKARYGSDVDLRLIARRTAGLSGAFLENVVNEAALLAARRGGDSISAADMDEAVDRATIGGKRSLKLSDALKKRIAAHEAGHVLANLLNENPEVRVPVNKVTIIPHGSGALGFAESGSEEGDKYLYTRAELEARLDTALGGLVAEKIFYNEWSTGPGSDLESATRVARAMVQQLGMSEEMGLAQTQPNQYGQTAFGSEVDAKALVEVNKLLKASMDRVERRLRAGAAKHQAMIDALMEKETLSAEEIEAIAHPKTRP